MKFHLFVMTILFYSSFALANGRKPAVEDFVGIEIDEPNTTPQGTEVLFNFEKDIAEYKTGPGPVEKNDSHWVVNATATPSSVMALILILGLPALSLFMVMHRFRHKAQLESASNIKVLEKYRKEREERRAKESLERKAS